MGLDTVELVMAIEEKFGIDIPDADAEHLGVLGDMQNYLVRTLRQRGDDLDEEKVWQTLSKIVVDQLGVRPDQVIRTAHVVGDLGAD